MVFVDFITLFLLAFRAIVAFALFEVIKNKESGFDETDLKPLHDNIQFVVYPSMLMCCSANMKIELLASYPLTLFCINYSYK